MKISSYSEGYVDITAINIANLIIVFEFYELKSWEWAWEISWQKLIRTFSVTTPALVFEIRDKSIWQTRK